MGRISQLVEESSGEAGSRQADLRSCYVKRRGFSRCVVVWRVVAELETSNSTDKLTAEESLFSASILLILNGFLWQLNRQKNQQLNRQSIWRAHQEVGVQSAAAISFHLTTVLPCSVF